MDVDLSETDRFLTVNIDQRVNFNISIYISLDNYSSSFLSFLLIVRLIFIFVILDSSSSLFTHVEKNHIDRTLQLKILTGKNLIANRL